MPSHKTYADLFVDRVADDCYEDGRTYESLAGYLDPKFRVVSTPFTFPASDDRPMRQVHPIWFLFSDDSYCMATGDRGVPLVGLLDDIQDSLDETRAQNDDESATDITVSVSPA